MTATVRRRRINLNSIPQGSEVELDGIYAGITPTELIEMTTYISGVEVERTVMSGAAIGIEWDQNVDEWNRIDEYGNALSLSTADFDAHSVWGGMRRCTVAPDGTINHYGSNPRGDGLDLTGADGRIMVETPKFYVKSLSPRAKVYDFWVSGVPKPGFAVWPGFLQRGGIERDYAYPAAFECTPMLKYRDHSINELQLDSKCALDAGGDPCSQPFTGGTDAIPCIAHVGFNTGTVEFVVGETLTCNTRVAKVVDWHLSGGAWDGTATGTLYIQIYNDPWEGGHWAAGNIVATGPVTKAQAVGAETNLSLTIANARTYANRIGPRWGIVNPWTLAGIQLLFYIEYANPNSQSAVGNGIVDKTVGEIGFYGEMCGANGMNDTPQMGINGTGMGSGTDGRTPIAYRGVENLWGNVWEFIDGWNAIGDAVTGKYHIIRRDGLGNINDVDGNGMLNAGNYETSLVVPTQQHEFNVNIEYEDLLKYLFISDGTLGGGDTTYLCDWWGAHVNNENNILLSGGGWYNTHLGGVANRDASNVLVSPRRCRSARLERI